MQESRLRVESCPFQPGRGIGSAIRFLIEEEIGC